MRKQSQKIKLKKARKLLMDKKKAQLSISLPTVSREK
jgi:hypothetical protein